MSSARRQRAKKPASVGSSIGEDAALGKHSDVLTELSAAPSSIFSVTEPPVARARRDEQASVKPGAISPNETARSDPTRITRRPSDTLSTQPYHNPKRKRDNGDEDALATQPYQKPKRKRDNKEEDAQSNKMKLGVTAAESSDSGYVTEGNSVGQNGHHENPHARDMDEFLSKVKDRVVGFFPLAPRKYAATHILFVTWTDADLIIGDEVEELENVLKEMQFTVDPAKFTTEQFFIPSKHSEYEVQAKFTELKRKTLMRDSLLMIYYGGHCRFEQRRSLLYAFQKPPRDWPFGEPPPKLDWAKVSSVFADESCVSDMLFIMDCCCAASTGNEALWPGGKKWLFAASGLNNLASAGNCSTDASFTRALIQELRALKGVNFYLQLLYTNLLLNQATRGLRTTPYLAAISKEATKSATGILFQYPDGEPDDITLEKSKREAKQCLESGVQVLISIRLDKSPKYVEDFVQWLTSAPPAELLGIDDISRDILRAEGAFKIRSTLILVSIPVSIWVGTTSDGSCTFIDIIRSPNLIQTASKFSEETEHAFETPTAKQLAGSRDTEHQDRWAMLSDHSYLPAVSKDQRDKKLRSISARANWRRVIKQVLRTTRVRGIQDGGEIDNDGNALNEVERIHRQVLAVRETALGKEHPDTLISMNNLASVLSIQGNYKEAKQIYQQALALMESELGKEHPSTLGTMNNLASVLNRQGKYQEAEQIHRQALALREKVLGKEHPDTLISMNNLALVLRSQGNFKEAERMHQQELALSERVLGKEHPSTLTSMNNLALVLDSQGNYKDAIRIHRQALVLKKRVLGENIYQH